MDANQILKRDLMPQEIFSKSKFRCLETEKNFSFEGIIFPVAAKSNE